jgi:RNA polymerase sigma-70 factor (ECF subfamily)
MPDEPTVLGLLALLLLLDSRRAARTGPDGLPVLLADQNRALFDQAKVQEGVVLLGEGLRRTPDRPDPYVVQAAIAACHVLTPAADWDVVCSWYDVLLTVQDTPAVRFARAVAVGERDGAQAGLAALDDVRGLDGSATLHGVRAELLARAGLPAATAYEAALALPLSAPQRRYLRERSEW